MKNKAKLAARAVLDELIFPWIEAKTGQYSSDKSMRKLVAERLEIDLSRTLWVSKEQALAEDGEVTNPVLFRVTNVFPQTKFSSRYELVVTFCFHERPWEMENITLEEFLRSFYPHQELTFEDAH